MKKIQIIREATIKDFESTVNNLLQKNWKINSKTFSVTDSHFIVIMSKKDV